MGKCLLIFVYDFIYILIIFAEEAKLVTGKRGAHVIYVLLVFLF